jgi:hypothetical protein
MVMPVCGNAGIHPASSPNTVGTGRKNVYCRGWVKEYVLSVLGDRVVI